MFVSTKKYRDLQIELSKLSVKFLMTQVDNMTLQKRVHILSKQNNNNEKPLDNKDIKKLLQLCHPDKHNGSNLASEMTSKLLSMRLK